MTATFGGGGAVSASLTSYSVSVTPANSNKVMYLCVTSSNTTAPNANPTFNTSESFGAAIASGTFGSGTRGWWLYRLTAPSSTTANATVTFASSSARDVNVVWYYDVDQTTPEDAADEAEGTGTSVTNTVTSAVGDIALGFIGTAGSSTQTEVDTEVERAGTGRLFTYELTGAASVSFNITLGTSRDWVCIGINVNSFASTSTTVQDIIGGGVVPFAR